MIGEVGVRAAGILYGHPKRFGFDSCGKRRQHKGCGTYSVRPEEPRRHRRFAICRNHPKLIGFTRGRGLRFVASRIRPPRSGEIGGLGARLRGSLALGKGDPLRPRSGQNLQAPVVPGMPAPPGSSPGWIQPPVRHSKPGSVRQGRWPRSPSRRPPSRAPKSLVRVACSSPEWV